MHILPEGLGMATSKQEAKLSSSLVPGSQFPILHVSFESQFLFRFSLF